MKQNPQYQVTDFDRYFDRGSDKVCYVSDKHPGCLLKLSPLERAAQMLREIQYFEFLKKRGIEPSFMPRFYGRCFDEKHVGFVQELIAGERIKPLGNIARIHYQTRLTAVEDALLELKQEMLEKNIIILDLHGGNIIGDEKTLRLWVIDGYGTPEFIPLPKYSRFFGRLKIERQWSKFVWRYTQLLSSISKEQGVWVPSKIALASYMPGEQSH